jgi:DNA uptake protein ComE-like DNA-binding protein
MRGGRIAPTLEDEMSLKKLLLMLAVVGVGSVSPGVGLLNAQVGKSLGVADINVAPEATIAATPGLTPVIAKALVAKRPFASITELNAFLLSQGLTQEQANQVYPKAFVHVNLNTATREEILLIPGAGTRMAREFPEYRPWRTWAQFDREISKYVGQEATDKLKQYVFIPMNANTAADADLMTISGVTAATIAKLKQGRPYASKDAFEQAMGRGGDPKEAARVSRFLVFQ